MLDRVIVQAPGESADNTLVLETAKGRIDGVSAADALEMLGSEYPTPAVAINTATHLIIN
jgi:hypothetical protein